MDIDVAFLAGYAEETAIGPVQRDEALFLYALTRLLRPRIVLEIGSLRGHSTRCFLAGGAELVIAVDLTITPELERLGAEFPDRLRLTPVDQVDVPVAALPGPIDLCFLDAAHDFEKDRATFRAIEPYLARGGLLAVHDTGAWPRACLGDAHREWTAGRKGRVLGDRLLHQPGAVAFVEWLRAARRYDVVDLGTVACLRHGITLVRT
jgi:predicted O-methyltransferase YrrM